MKLKISDDLSLPIDAATQTFAFIARKGAGKTYAAGKLTELLIDAGVQCVVLDTVGNWYGLRLSADGKGVGIDIPVFGGLRGDIPLEATGGELIADIVVDSGRSLILDISQFSLGDRKRFATAFGERLWKRKKGESHPSPLMLIIEESQLIVPERASADTARMLGIYEEIIRLGRNYGIGCTMISQRPQSVNKEVLNQTECLFVGQVNGAQERKALKLWVTHQGMSADLVDELPSLPVGTMYAWSPQWLNVLQKVKIAPKRTYDASATPKVGEKRVQRELKPIDLDELKQKMAATIERAKADDPRELRKQIADLKKQLQQRPAETKQVEKIVEVPVLKNGMLERTHKLADRIEGIAEKFGSELTELRRLISPAFATRPAPKVATRPAQVTAKPVIRNFRTTASTAVAEGELTGPEQRILNAIAWLNSIGVENPENGAVAFVAGYSPTSTGYTNPRGALRAKGMVEYLGGDTLKLTDTGAANAETSDSPPTEKELHDRILAKLPTPERRILVPLLMARGQVVDNETVAQAAGYSHTSTGYTNPRGRLRTLGLVEYRDGGVAARSILFL